MIRIERGPVPSTIKVYSDRKLKALDGVTLLTKAEKEIEDALDFFTDPTNFNGNVKLTKKSFSFSVYKNPELVAALGEVFGTKCAYCESQFGAVSPKDIEHFRPKSEVDTGTALLLRPGYFWLAGDWDNLLVSCIDCNRSRKHEVPDQPGQVKLGKGTQFPLEDEGRRLRNHGILASEDPVRLLVNPCADDPEEFFTFDEKGLIHKRASAPGRVGLMAEKSIYVYALQRKGLVEARVERLNTLRTRIRELSDLIFDYNELIGLGAPQESLDRKKEKMGDVIAILKEMFARKAPYLGMLRDWIRTGKQRGNFNDLQQFGIDLAELI